MAKTQAEIIQEIGSIGSNKSTFRKRGSNVTQILAAWGGGLIKGLQKGLDKNDSNASASLRQSINWKVKSSVSSVNFKLSMNDYYYFVDKGRKPGKFPPKKNIMKYINDKHIVPKSKNGGKPPSKEGLAFLISRSIAENGFKGTNFYSKVVNDRAIKRLKKELIGAMKGDALLEIKSLAKEFNGNNNKR